LTHRFVHRGRLSAVCLALLMLAATPARSADEPIQAARLHADEHIVLDGTLSHPAWQRALAFDRSHEIEPVRGRTPTHGTKVQVLYDDKALYVGVTALDPEPSRIRAPLVRHDQVNRTQDFVVLYVDPIGAKQAAQFFRVGASGSTADGLHTASNDGEDFSPDFDFDSAVAGNDQGYTVVFRVPYSSLRYTSANNRQWRMMVGRRIPRENVTLTLSVPLPREALSFIDMLQPIEGFEPPTEHGFLQLRPTVTLRRTDDQPYGEARDSASRLKTSLDLKWRALPELVVDATLNPDFAQVALDQPQLSGNTRFALFLTEKRPFFLESADLLISPTDALYTRSINDPRWGLRGTWRGDRDSGTAMVLRDKGGGLTPIPNAYGTNFALQPASDALMSRAQMNLGRVSLGGIVGNRRYKADDGANAGENTVAGVDGQWLITDNLRLKAQAMQSHTTALDDGSGVLQRGTSQRGGMAFVDLYARTNRTETDLSIQEVTQGFRNDLGFVAQSNVRKLAANQNIQWFELGPINQLNLYVDIKHQRERGSGQTVLQRFTPGLWMAGPRNSQFTLEINTSEKSRVQRDAPLLNARYVHLTAEGTLGTWAPLAEVWLDTGRMADVLAGTTGRVVPGHKLGVEIQSRLLPRLELHPRVETVVFNNPVEGHYRETASQLLGIWHIAAQQTLRLILQRHSYGRDGDVQAETAKSLTYAWRRSAGTVLYLGATRGDTGLPAMPSRSTEVFAKLQLDVDEWRRGDWAPWPTRRP
jgi:hypothetical protein